MSKSAKMTRKQYTATRATLEAVVVGLNATLDALNNSVAGGRLLMPALADSYDALHDAIHDAKVSIKDLDGEWNRRNWTGADYSSWELVCANVD